MYNNLHSVCDLVVFDMAGTTVHDGDAVNVSLRDALLGIARCDVSRDLVNSVMGIQKPIAIRQLLALKNGAEPADTLINQTHDEFVRRMMEYYASSPAVREIEGVSDLFRHLRSIGIKVGIDTGFNRAIAQIILDRLGWEKNNLIDVSVTADEVVAGRPAPFMIYRCMEKTGVHQASRVCKIGDTPSDLHEGTSAGCGLVIGVTQGSHTAEELLPHPHTHLIPTVKDLPRCLERSLAITDQTRLRLFTPGPLTTSATVKRAMLRDIGAWDKEVIEVIADIRRSLLKLAGLSRDDGYESVLMQGSGTFGVESVVQSLIPSGGRLLVAANGAYGQRIAQIAKRTGILATTLQGNELKPITANRVAEAMQSGERYDAVAVVHCETTTGLMNPIEEIGPVVKKFGCRFIVDAMSSFGAIDTNWKASGVDALISSSNKCIEGVPGFSFSIVRRDWLESSTNCARSLSLDLVDQWREFESTGRFRFTPPTHVLRAFQQALRELEDEGGVSARQSRYQLNHRRLVAGMAKLGFDAAVAPDWQSHFITTFLEPSNESFDFGQFYNFLRERGLIIYAGKLTSTRCFRIGNIGQLTPGDIDELLNQVSRFAQKAKD